MRVIVAQSAGFCRGVRRAVEKARRLASSQPKPLFTDGPLIHNQQMMDRLRREGVREAEAADGLRDAVLLIRAHGIPPERRSMLKKLPVDLVDCTCPDVARIQGMIRAHKAKGYDIVIFGDAGHAEVIGLQGHAGEKGHVVTRPTDVRSLPPLGKVCLVAQSTQFPEAYAEIAAAVRERFDNVTVLDTICPSTRNRQQELRKMANEVDAIVVVGGAHSANTRRLVELARALKPTFHIQDGSQLQAKDFAAFSAVGLTGGASTPAFLLDDVRRILEEMGCRKEP